MKTKFISAALVAALACALQPISAVATNSQRDDRSSSDYTTTSVEVSVADLDVNSPVGARAAYERIVRAANHVCGSRPDAKDLLDSNDWDTCYDDAVAQAVAEANSPALSARAGLKK